jgi:murein DD-endopeptidase MepM/ murein hydrolase activator NlpD
MIKRILSLCALLPQLALAQTSKNYPKGYFRDPLEIPIQLAGNFGEIRPNHFHAGLDIKTNQQENLAVHAAAEGYVSRIGVSHLGYGNVIYISHPNGYTTVYGHLNRFFPALEQYVKEQQYAAESWASDLKIPANKFPVKKGDFIAWSGNTGGSAGPHVHFEIRNTQTEKAENGLLFGMPIADNRAPDVYRIGFYDMSLPIYSQTPQIIAVKNIKGVFTTTAPVIKVKADKIGLGINALDHMGAAPNSYGIYEVVQYSDETVNGGFQIDNVGFDETRYVNSHIDYKLKKNNGPTLQLIFCLPGDKLDIYKGVKGNGVIDLSDEKPHPVRLAVKDAYGNTSTVKLTLQRSEVNKGLPPLTNLMFPGSKNNYENNHVKFTLDENALYDRISFNYAETPGTAKSYSAVYHLQNAAIPLHTPYKLYLRPTKPVPEAIQNKMVIVREGQGESIAPATFDNSWYVAEFRDFGNFHLEADTIAPKIEIVGGIKPGANLSKASKLSFTMSDASGIKTYRAELDGHWLMFSRRNNTLTYTFDEHCPAGEHKLVLTVADIVGNIKTYTLSFTR